MCHDILVILSRCNIGMIVRITDKHRPGICLCGYRFFLNLTRIFFNFFPEILYRKYSFIFSVHQKSGASGCENLLTDRTFFEYSFFCICPFSLPLRLCLKGIRWRCFRVTALQRYSVTIDEIEMTCLGIVCLLF